jgi:hypothetical protein
MWQLCTACQVLTSCGARAGETVTCKVVNVDPSKGRVALSLKQLQPDPLTQNPETALPSMDDASVRCPRAAWLGAVACCGVCMH